MFEVLFYDRKGEVLQHGIYDTWAAIEVDRPVECARVDIAVAYRVNP